MSWKRVAGRTLVAILLLVILVAIAGIFLLAEH